MKMKKFKIPEMQIIEFGNDEIITSSGCAQVYACISCYCGFVMGCNPHMCSELNCPTLSNYL